MQAELTQLEEIARLFDEVERRCGGLDILVNNAGRFSPTPLPEASEDQWDSLLDSNVKAQFFCAQRAAPLLRRSGRGRIVNFASLGGLLAWSKYTAYCVSKAGVIMLTRCLARELAPEVTVNAIAPGTISFPDDAPEIAATFIRQAPLRRTGEPQDIVDAVSYLVHAPFVTGQVLVVDGGRSIPYLNQLPAPLSLRLLANRRSELATHQARNQRAVGGEKIIARQISRAAPRRFARKQYFAERGTGESPRKMRYRLRAAGPRSGDVCGRLRARCERLRPVPRAVREPAPLAAFHRAESCRREIPTSARRRRRGVAGRSAGVPAVR